MLCPPDLPAPCKYTCVNRYAPLLLLPSIAPLACGRNRRCKFVAIESACLWSVLLGGSSVFASPDTLTTRHKIARANMERVSIRDGSETDAIAPLPNTSIKLSTRYQPLLRHVNFAARSEGALEWRLTRTNFHRHGSFPQRTMSAPSFGTMMAPEIGLAGVVCHTGFRAHYVQEQGGEVPSSISADGPSHTPELTSARTEDHHDMFARGRFRIAPNTVPCLLDQRQGSLVKRGRFAVSVEEADRAGALRKTAHGGSRLKEEHHVAQSEPQASNGDELAQLYDEAQAATTNIASLATEASNGRRCVTTDLELLLLGLLEAQRESLAAENAALCQQNEWMKQQLSNASVLGF